MQNNSASSLLVLITLLLLFSITTISGSISLKSSTSMAENPEQSSSSEPAPSSGVYIVYTEEPHGGAEPESFHLSTLSSVLGSEDAAKDSLVYVYQNAATGFSAKLTSEQVSEIKKQPGVLQVVKSQTLKLHGARGAGNMKI